MTVQVEEPTNLGAMLGTLDTVLGGLVYVLDAAEKAGHLTNQTAVEDTVQGLWLARHGMRRLRIDAIKD